MDYFDFNMQLPDEWSDSEKTSLTKTPLGTPKGKPGGSGTVQVTVSVSYVFHPYNLLDDVTPDLVLASSDQVLFYVHFHRLLSASENGFAALLPSLSCQPTMNSNLPNIMMPDPAEVLNVVAHTIYGISALEFHPSFDTISTALDALLRYGLPPKRYACAGQPLYELIVFSAPLRPIDTYALAAMYDLEDAAAAASAHLLAFPLVTITDELATRIGPIYLKKLFFLHFGRIEALKHALLQPPATHPETPCCSLAQQGCLTRAWALAAAHVVWDAGPNLSTHLLQASLLPLQEELTCPKCKLALRDRVAHLVIEWASVKRTI